jgi:hypothetical protein
VIAAGLSLSSSCSPRCTSAKGEFRCPEAVVFSAQTKRWFITMGHASFNSRANNGRGYATEGAARKAILLPRRLPARRDVRILPSTVATPWGGRLNVTVIESAVTGEVLGTFVDPKNAERRAASAGWTVVK